MLDIVVNATRRETRIALLEQRVVTELFLERQSNDVLVGNIYCGRVAKILPGMQAAFVDVGLPKAGFLHVSDILVDPHTLPWGDELLSLRPEPGQNDLVESPSPPVPAYAIETLLEEGQEILVQVAKEPLGTKGCRLTTFLSLAGRYLVLMPGVAHIGVSRRIPDEAEKERLRTCVQTLLPEGMGCILRTLSAGVSGQELHADVHFLSALWQHIQRTAAAGGAPRLVHREMNLVLRTLRDYLTAEVERVIIDDESMYTEARAFLEAAALPQLAANVILYQDAVPVFEAFHIEKELERALQRKVWLKSGGYLVIDHTEALVAIDVNTGRFVGKSDPATTMLTTNLEAVQEIVRQLRLRNIGGLVILDLIDMDIEAHRQLVFEALEEALRHDRARTKILPMSEFGLVEMTRKRVRASLEQMLCEPCSHCRGTGRVESLATVCGKLFREIQRVVHSTPATRKVMVHAHPSVVALLYNEEKTQVAALEQTWHMTLAIQGDNEMPQGQFEVLAL